MEVEIWKEIPDTEGKYLISNLGNVFSARKNKVLVTTLISNGYKSVRILGKNRYIHRMVAEAFIPNPDNKPVIDHIDHNIQNNSIDNLRWATYKENSNNQNAHKPHKSKAVIQYSLDGKQILIYQNSRVAGEFLNCNRRHITECCNGKRNHVAGYVWRYEGDSFSFNPKRKAYKQRLLNQF